jgi:uncharacterized protein YggE
MAATDSNDGPTGIVVQGTGRVAVDPDVATLRVGVSLVDPDLVRARREAGHKVSAARDRLLTDGVAPGDIRTARLDVHTSHDRPGNRRNHHVSTTLEAVVRDVAAAEAIVDRLFAEVGSGLELHGLEFDVTDRRPGRDRALELAVADARQTAERLAELAGVELGPVVSIRELADHHGPGFVPLAAAARMSAADAPVPVEAGRLELRVGVAMRFSITEGDRR